MKSPSERRERSRAALKTLSELTEDPSIALRDPDSAVSYSCVTTEVRDSQLAQHKREQEKEHEALSPLGLDGRPLRRYSERLDDHWFQGEAVQLSPKVMANDKEGKLKHLEALVSKTEFMLLDQAEFDGRQSQNTSSKRRRWEDLPGLSHLL